MTRVPERSEERSALDAGAAGARRKSQPSTGRLWKIGYVAAAEGLVSPNPTKSGPLNMAGGLAPRVRILDEPRHGRFARTRRSAILSVVTWLRWLIVALTLTDAGYMAIDGTRGLTAGDYFTPTSGDNAGELGPWARIMESVGMAPRSTPMKAFFVTYGLIWIAVTVAFAMKYPWSWLPMLVLAIGSVWYLTIGTIVSVVVSILLFVPAVRELYSS